MQNLLIEVIDGKLHARVNGLEVGSEVTKLTFTANTNNGSHAPEYTLELSGMARFSYGAGHVATSPFVEQMVAVAQSIEIS